MVMTYASVTGRITIPGTEVGIRARVTAQPMSTNSVLVFDDRVTWGPRSVETDSAGNMPTGASALKIPQDSTLGDVVLWRFTADPLDRLPGVSRWTIATQVVTVDTTVQALTNVDVTAVTTALVATVGENAAAAAASETAAAGSATAAAGSATTAEGWASAAASSAADSDISADLAAVSETTATTKATEAAASETAAAGSATAAGTSETNAAASAATATTKAGEASASATSAQGYAQQAAGSVSLVAWAPATVYAAGDVRQAPDGSTVRRNANGTSRASFDATEQAEWTAIGAVPGTIEETALKASYAPKWKPNTAYTAGDVVLSPSGRIVQRVTSGTSGTTYSDTNWAGVRLRVGAREFPTSDPSGFVKLLLSDTQTGGMSISIQKTLGDSADVNVDGSISVKHAKGYAGTPGYADTLQVYTLAGSEGTIIGNNNYQGYGSELPYSPGTTEVGSGFVRFELGPIWPRSEVGRFNNKGDLIIGWTPNPGGYPASQTGTTVTVTGVGPFTANHVGQYTRWTGKHSVADRILAIIDANNVTVETSRTIASDAVGIGAPVTLIRSDGVMSGLDGLRIKARVYQPTGHIQEWLSTTETVLASVSTTGKAAFPTADIGTVHMAAAQVVIGVAAADASVDGAADVFIKAAANNEKGLVIQPKTSSQTANLFETQYADKTFSFAVEPEGRLKFPAANTQTTVGAAGVASALPATPSKYIKMYVDGTLGVVPWYAAS